MVWCYFFSLETSEGIQIRPFDLPEIPFTSLQTALAAESLCGPDFNITDQLIDNMAEPLTRSTGLFEVIALSKMLQESDKDELEDAVSIVFSMMVEGQYSCLARHLPSSFVIFSGKIRFVIIFRRVWEPTN